MIGIYFAIINLFPDFIIFGYDAEIIYWIIGIFVATFLVARVISTLLNWYMHKISKEQKTVDHQILPIMQKIIMIIAIIIAVIISLHMLGVNVTPAAAGLGLGGLVFALALQDSLGNLFSGIHIMSDKTLKVKDYISLENGKEGWIEEIGWRTMKIRTKTDEIIIIPNSVLAKQVAVNHSLPTASTRLTIRVGVAYDSDIKLVEKLLLDAAKSCKDIEKDPVPSVKLIDFGDSALVYELDVWTKNYPEYRDIMGEVRTKALELFRANKVNIPFPIRTIYMKQSDYTKQD